MIFQRGEDSKELKDFGEILSVFLNKGYVQYAMERLWPEEFLEIKKKYTKELLLAPPTYYCIIDKTFHILPVPDQQYEIRVIYYPHAREM